MNAKTSDYVKTKPTHKFTANNGHTYIGVLPMCDDHKTWMKEPVCAFGVTRLEGT